MHVERRRSDEEILGADACRAADALAAAAPPVAPQQRNDLAALLRRAAERRRRLVGDELANPARSADER